MIERSGVVPVLLPEDLHRGIAAALVIPTWTKDAVAQDQPVVVAVAGPPGSGKSAWAAVVKAALDQRGGAVLVGSDHYKTLHPHYQALLATDDRTAGVRVRPTVRRWQAALEDEVRRGRFDAVVETALADPHEFRTAAQAYRVCGHRVEVSVVAAADAWSQLGIVDRYLRQTRATGTGRYVSWDNRDHCARGLLETLAVIETEGLADRITVISRTGQVLYTNELLSGAWREPTGAAAAVTRERERAWSAAETWAFRRRLAAVEQRLGRDAVPQRQLAASQALERAFALAEPQRRTAQVSTGAPGVDYHRLSPAEHRWTFDELIVPGHLEGVGAQEQPVAVYVMGQPGAGKSGIARLVLRALAARGPVHITAEKFKAAHPDYFDLLATHPRTAGTRIRADVKLWQRQAEEYVRARRGDLVIETAPGSAKEFLEGALLFHRAGYRVHLVVLAVRAADSRQGTAQRYADAAARWGIAGRFTSRAGHDRCYDAIAVTVHLAETDPAIASVQVLDRDARHLWFNERPEGSGLLRAPRADQALAAERLRPYSLAETTRFLALQRCLRRALPQYRPDLDEIDALARPLLPAPLRPAPLVAPRSAVMLPLPARSGERHGYGLAGSWRQSLA